MSIARRIIEEHLVKGKVNEGNEIAVRIDQTLTQDATGTMAYLQFEALGIPKVKTKLSLSYADHNISESGKENIEFLESFAKKYRIVFSKPGNGICHQLHLERFATPGTTLLGSDSHTPTAGGIGSLAIGAGGLDVAAAMAGQPFYLKMPRIIGIRLTGRLNEWVSAKDIVLFLLKKYSVKGGVGRIFEFFGDGVKSLSVPERATITNMCTELGATTSIFPSDEATKKFLDLQGRGNDFAELKSDEEYNEVVEIHLEDIVPLIAKPSSPDNVAEVKDLEGTTVGQVIIGSCTNSSYKDLAIVSSALKDKKIKTKLNINPGSINVINSLKKNGLLENITGSGAEICEAACLGCIGIGQEPEEGIVSLRTFNRNFPGRSGTRNDKVYLCSAETAVASVVFGKITDPRKLGECPRIAFPEKYLHDDCLFVFPTEEDIEIKRGGSIKPLPLKEPLENAIKAYVLIKVKDNITTDDIMPAGSKILPLRSNIPAISEYVFHNLDSSFAKRAKEKSGGIIVAGENYGQGSSREHAALAPMYLGIKAVIAKSFSRIHKANLVNFGILPLEFADKEDYERIEQSDEIEMDGVIGLLNENKNLVVKNSNIKLKYELSKREREILIAGGKLNYIKRAMKDEA
ncbi:aconitate hydratase [Candidatus Woesearchaeota archaeon]|nr:aconitate hydratase [Candidatus Woesearchaeota archaeon]